MKHLFPACLLILTSQVSAQSWIPDSLFADQARLVVSPGATDDLNTLLVQPNGMIIAAGYDLNTSANDYHNNMVRFDICGAPDTAFGSGGIVHHKFSQRNQGFSYALQADGKILACGIQASSNAGSGQIPFVARYHSNGSPDTTFGTGGTHTLRFDNISSGGFYSVAQLPDGRILCGGVSNANINGGTHGFGLMRFMPDGTLDTSFSGDGKTRFAFTTSARPQRAVILQNGDIVVAGRHRVGNGDTYFAATRFDSTGITVSSFGNSGVFTDTVSLVHSFLDAHVALQANDHVVMACTRKTASSGVQVIRFTPAGVLDPAFGTNGHVQLSVANMECQGIRITGNGSIQVFGKAGNTGRIIQLDPAGAIDSTFGLNGHLSLALVTGSHYIGALADLPNNRLLAGGASGDMAVMRLTTVSNVPHITGDASLLTTTGPAPYQWFVDSTLISGATSSTHVPVVNGNYTVSVIDDLGCPYHSAPFPVQNVGVGEHGRSQPFQLFPNPAESVATVRFNGTGTATLQIRDLQKRVVKERMEVYDGKPIHLDALPAGVYIVELVNGRTTYVQKLVRR